ERGHRVAAGRPRLHERRARRARRPPRQELDQRGLHPQHARRVACLYDERAGRAGGGMKRALRRDRRLPKRAPRRFKFPPLDLARCERFLMHEARLLDEARFDEWLALFTEDAWYWIPIEPEQKSPFDTVSLIYDDRRLLETRVRRLASPRI